MVPVDEEKTMKDIWASTESSLESPNFPGSYEAHIFKTVTYHDQDLGLSEAASVLLSATLNRGDQITRSNLSLSFF